MENAQLKTTAVSDYDEALFVISNPNCMILAERRHLTALYKRIWELEQIREKIETRLVNLLVDVKGL
jgi:hypothetical protein